MQLFYITVVGAGGYQKLYDESAQALPYSDLDAGAAGPNAYPSFEPDFTGASQEDQLFTKPDATGKTVVNAFRQPLSNVSVTVPVSLNAAYKTRDDAMASIAAFAALLQMKVHFKVVQGGTVHYYPNAVVKRYRAKPVGLSCTHDFTFTSDTVTTALPPVIPP